MGTVLPFALTGIILDITYPNLFRADSGPAGDIIGCALLALGIPLWLSSVYLVLRYVPRKKLITTGPFALLLHPLYTSVSLLVIPGLGLLLDSWFWIAMGIILYVFSRIFSAGEEKILDEIFPGEYRSYRSKVMFPWL